MMVIIIFQQIFPLFIIFNVYRIHQVIFLTSNQSKDPHYIAPHISTIFSLVAASLMQRFMKRFCKNHFCKILKAILTKPPTTFSTIQVKTLMKFVKYPSIQPTSILYRISTLLVVLLTWEKNSKQDGNFWRREPFFLSIYLFYLLLNCIPKLH